jgi:hypothetical protein
MRPAREMVDDVNAGQFAMGLELSKTPQRS